MKKIWTLILVILTYVTMYAQNIIIQQNNQQVPSEKVVIKEKHVPIYIKEQPPALTQPVLIYGYLHVYPVDLGLFQVQDFPYQVIQNINKVNAYGRNTWRLPTKEELSIMESTNGGLNNINGKLQLGAVRYMIQNASGTPVRASSGSTPDLIQAIRLVSTN